MFYTYFHTRNDTGAVFYVGKGKGSRAHSTKRSNPHWSRIVAKHGHTVHIAALWPTEAEAFEHEKFLIACFRELAPGLCNMTDGGDGVSGYSFTDEARKKISSAGKGRAFSEDHKRRIGEANSRRPVPQRVLEKFAAANACRVVTDETRKKMAASHTNNPKCMGHTRTPEVRAAISAKLTGHTPSEATRAKLAASSALRENKRPALGMKHTAESKARISAGVKLRQEKRKQEACEPTPCGMHDTK